MGKLMTNSKHFNKIEIESADGTRTDITKYVQSVVFQEKRSFWQKIKDWWNYRKIRKWLIGFPKGEIEITGTYDPCGAYKDLHKN